MANAVRPVMQLVMQPHVTPRQLQIIQLVAEGLTYRQIGLALTISKRTVCHHLSNALHRTGYLSVPQLVAQFVAAGYVAVNLKEPQAVID